MRVVYTPQANLGKNAASNPESAKFSKQVPPLTIYTGFPIDHLDEQFSDVLFHELIHLVDIYERQGELKQARPEPVPFEKRLPKYIEMEKKGASYQAAWRDFQKKHEYRVVDSPNPEKARNDLQSKFETARYGKDFSRTRYLWQDTF